MEEAEGKAVKSRVGGTAEGSPETRKAWAEDLIPREDREGTRPLTGRGAMGEANIAAWNGWGKGDVDQAKKEIIAEAEKSHLTRRGLPQAHISRVSAPGRTGGGAARSTVRGW